MSERAFLPQVNQENESYWSSGEGGALRFQQCQSCAGLIHPPQPICPYCRSLELDVTEVSGFGRLIGFTLDVNTRLPGLPSPYIVAQVSIEEDDRVRLTTNIAGSDVARLQLGQRMRVYFEKAEDDVWLPLFETVDDDDAPTALPADEIAPEEFSRYVRPMITDRKFEENSAISGIGASRMGRRLMVAPLALTVEACLAAIDDAGLAVDDIDGLSTYPGDSVPGMSEGGVIALESALRIRPTWYNGGGQTPGPGGSVIAAMMAVSAGLAKHVLCFRTVWQSTHQELTRMGRIRHGDTRIGAPMDYVMPFGASAPQLLAMSAQRHMHTYGTTKEALGWIALNARANAAINPTAVYRTPLTMDDYMAARPITTPFGLYDCDVPVDASVAVIVSSVDAARDAPRPAIRFEAVGTQLIEPVPWDQSTLTHEPQVLGPAAHLWSRSALRPADMDVALLYDGFTFNCLSWLEGLGFCKIGEGGDFVAGGTNIARDGLLPLNTHGGQLSHGRTHGMGLLHEAVTQLRGDGGLRQVDGATAAVVSSGGLTPSAAMVLTVDG